MKSRYAAGAFVIALLTVSVVVADEALKSGPEVGKNIPGPFHPLNLTGAKADEKNCLV